MDQSERMLVIAGERAGRRDEAGDALSPPFADGAFERVVSGHFYGHLEADDRTRFLAHARRLAPELVLVDSHVRPDHEQEERQERVLNDGSRHVVYKRYFTGESLASEVGGGDVLHEGVGSWRCGRHGRSGEGIGDGCWHAESIPIRFGDSSHWPYHAAMRKTNGIISGGGLPQGGGWRSWCGLLTCSPASTQALSGFSGSDVKRT